MCLLWDSKRELVHYVMKFLLLVARYYQRGDIEYNIPVESDNVSA